MDSNKASGHAPAFLQASRPPVDPRSSPGLRKTLNTACARVRSPNFWHEFGSLADEE